MHYLGTPTPPVRWLIWVIPHPNNMEKKNLIRKRSIIIYFGLSVDIKMDPKPFLRNYYEIVIPNFFVTKRFLKLFKIDIRCLIKNVMLLICYFRIIKKENIFSLIYMCYTCDLFHSILNFYY